MTSKVAFMFVAPQTDRTKAKAKVVTPVAEITTIGVQNYAEAEEEALKLVAEGITVIELCAGFGHDGTARIAKAVAEKALVGVVRFDLHPMFEHQSGDALFA
ncbi:DUF6506 family protein [Rhizomicrobium electricum]|uniref:DUF6506 family protein n=1 Tax=Rhizomicrobium electricum TaxID=480070 RepID=A0ABP3PZD6_9PROT|nr:DUF6506 family protein [Rhizomicrobium electricum]NIJ50175.1 hypothetical protein [Rhizomicrobium electricum]